MTELDLLNEISKTLADIRDLLKAAPPPAGAKPVAPAAKWERGPDDEIAVPQPSRVVHKAEEIEVHFGKNTGKRLGDLNASSLSWYAAKWEPRPKDNGALWPNDSDLLAAARTLWHQRQKTLRTAATGDKSTTLMNAPAPPAAKPAGAPMPATAGGDEEVLF